MTTYQPNVAGDISSYFQNIYEDALLVTRDNNIMSQLVFIPPASGNESEARKLSQFTGATMNSITDVDDLTSQAFTPSVIATLTPGMFGGQYWLTDKRLNSSPFEERTAAAQDLGQSMATKIETDILGDFASFTGGTVGTAGSVITWGNFFAMESRLKAQKAPAPYFFVCHPYQWHILAKAASVAGTQTNASPDLLNAVNSDFFQRRVGNVYVFTTSNLTPDASDDAVLGMFSRNALAFDVRRAPRLEPERDASRGGGGWELNMTGNYAHGVWRSTWGIQGTFDASVPSS